MFYIIISNIIKIQSGQSCKNSIIEIDLTLHGIKMEEKEDEKKEEIITKKGPDSDKAPEEDKKGKDKFHVFFLNKDETNPGQMNMQVFNEIKTKNFKVIECKKWSNLSNIILLMSEEKDIDNKTKKSYYAYADNSFKTDNSPDKEGYTIGVFYFIKLFTENETGVFELNPEFEEVFKQALLDKNNVLFKISNNEKKEERIGFRNNSGIECNAVADETEENIKVKFNKDLTTTKK